MSIDLPKRYGYVHLLGKGGMGEVYLVEDRLKENQKVALKVVLREGKAPSDLYLFKKEFQRLAMIHHENIAPVYDFGVLPHQEGYYYTSQYISGKPFNKDFQPSSEEELLQILLSILNGLAYLHSQKILHNDIKGNNILLCPQGRTYQPVLIDFGLASKEEEDRDRALLAGTITHIAPERILSNPPSPASDLYSLGVTLYEVLTGRLPFLGQDSEILEQHLHHEPKDPRTIQPQISPFLAELVIQLLQKDPQKRPASAAKVWEWIMKKKRPFLSPQTFQDR